MATKLTKDLSRELPDPMALIVTLTETGISLRAKRHRKGLKLTWDQFIAAATFMSREEPFADQNEEGRLLLSGLAKLGVKRPDVEEAK
jgi:hypothetical protein